MLDRREFPEELRHALNHLYDADVLAHSPLATWLDAGHAMSAEELRDALEQAIDAFRPSEAMPPDSRERRIYAVLRGRYVDHLTQQAVAARLRITPRHLRREQERAIQILIDYLILKYDLYPIEIESHRTKSTERVEINREMLWLADSQRDQVCRIDGVLQQAEELARAVAEDHGVAIRTECSPGLPLVAVPAVVLRQIVLNLLIAFVGALSKGGHVNATASSRQGHIVLGITAVADPWLRGDDALDSAVAMSRQLTELFGGHLTLADIEGLLAIQVVVPIYNRMATILAIEDNVDTLQLWTRYVQGTRFSLVQEPDPSRSVERAVQLQPDLILLDVMLPGIDGWELLRSLRGHPKTEAIPIVVCTVLPQQELAVSLGASGFIQKPATGRAFRAMLESQISGAERTQ